MKPLLLLAILFALLFSATAQIPPQNPEDQKKTYAEMLEKGKAAILEQTKNLETNEARYALEGMARRALDPDAKAEWRTTYETAILEALAAAPSDYLIKMLHWAGTEKSVDGLAKHLGHERLYDNALRALTTIHRQAGQQGKEKAAAAVRSSLPNTKDRVRIAHIQALGTMEDVGAVDGLLKEVEGDHKAFALQSLAQIGHPKAEAAILDNIDFNQRGTGTAWALNYASNLARTGHREKGAAIARKLYTERAEAGDGHIQARALSVLTDIEGAEATDELLAAFDGPSTYVKAQAAKLLATIPGTLVSEKVAAKYKAADDAGKRNLVDVLASRNAPAALDLLAGSLDSKDEQLQEAAISAIAGAGGARAIEALGKATLAGNEAAAKALPRVADAGQIAGLFANADTPEEKNAVLGALDAAGAKGQMAVLLSALQDGDADVRKNAARVARNAAQPDDLGALFDVLKKAEKSDRRRVLAAMQAAGQREPDVAKRVDAFDSLAATAKGKDLDDLLVLLAATEQPAALKRIAATDSDAAVRQLAKWKTADALPALLDAAERRESTRAVALNAIQRFADNASVADLERAIAIAGSEEQKKRFQGKLEMAKLRAIKGWVPLMDGNDPKKNWQGDFSDLSLKDGVMVFGKKNKNLYSKKEYSDFVLDFEFKLTPGANNGLGLRVPNGKNPSRDGFELQILDNTAERYAKLKDWQFHGSLYAASAAKKGHLKPVGEWNQQTVLCIGQHVKVILNGETILDTYLDKLTTLDGTEIKGLKAKKGHIAFAAHGEEVHFRKMKVKSFAVDKPGDLPKKGQGFHELFNGKNLDGWKGLVGNPKSRAAMTAEALAAEQSKADARAAKNWQAKKGVLVFNGRGQNLCTAADYADFDFVVDWKIEKNGDSGIYLRGSPQVQIWDTTNPAQKVHGNEKGSGGLWNNEVNPRDPVEKADKPVGEWNRFYIRMVNDRVNIWLNGKHVVQDTILENYWERDKPIYPSGAIELQNHGNKLYFDNIWVRELPR